MNVLTKKLQNNYIQIENFSDIPKYKCWIPNNSGFVRPNLIGLTNKNTNRLRLKSKVNDSSYDLITIDNKLDLRDNLSNIKFNKTNIQKKEYEYDYNDCEIFINSIRTVKNINNGYVADNCISYDEYKNSNDSNVGFVGKAYLYMLTPKDHKNFENTFLNKTKLNNQQIIPDDKTNANILNDISEWFGLNDKDNFNYGFSIEYTIEKKGHIVLENFKIHKCHEKDMEVDITDIFDEYGQRYLIQQLYTQIKRIIHGDNHHHYKADTILTVVKENDFKKEQISEQMLLYLKTLDKVEQKRETLPLDKYIPSFSYDCDGIKCYLDVYSLLYMKADNKKNIDIELATIITRSLKIYNDRNKKAKELKENFGKKYVDFFKSLIPLFILIFGISTFIVTSGAKFEKLSNLGSASFAIASTVDFIVSKSLWLSVCALLIIFYPYIYTNYIFKIFLFKDSRPRDMQTVKLIMSYHTDEYPEGKFARIKKALWFLLIPLFIYLTYNFLLPEYFPSFIVSSENFSK